MPSDKQPSKTSEHRRSNKPIMEKKRRARINNCLNELKNLLLEAMRKDPARHSKLEKADILEMTVNHLKSLQRQQMALSVAVDPGVVTKYRAGFNECAEEVSRYVGSLDGIDSPIKQRLLNHLANCMNGLGLMMTTSGSPSPLRTNAGHHSKLGGNGNGASGPNAAVPPLQLIQSRLPNGEIALLLPNQAMGNWQLSKQQQQQQRFVPIYNSRDNGASPKMTLKTEPSANGVPRSTLLTVNVGYHRGSSPSRNFADETSVPSPAHSVERCGCRCESRSSLSPAMSDYSDSYSGHRENPSSSSSSSSSSGDLPNAGGHFDTDVNWPRNTLDFPPEKSLPTGSCDSQRSAPGYGRSVRRGGAAVEPELLIPVNLSKDAADRMWRPW